MFSEFESVFFMGMSDSEIIFSEENPNAMEFNFLVRRPTLDFSVAECDFSPLQEEGDLEPIPQEKERVQELKQQQEEKKEEEEEDKYKFLVSSLEIKLPSIEEEFKKNNIDDEDGFKTPTSLDHKIPEISQCPPAPRKPKSLPSTKQKWPRRRALLDLSNEIDSLFPPSLVGGKIKKIRPGN